MVPVYEMNELVDDDVVDEPGRGLDDSPVEAKGS
jgi:hypothetical protein